MHNGFSIVGGGVQGVGASRQNNGPLAALIGTCSGLLATPGYFARFVFRPALKVLACARSLKLPRRLAHANWKWRLTRATFNVRLVAGRPVDAAIMTSYFTTARPTASRLTHATEHRTGRQRPAKRNLEGLNA